MLSEETRRKTIQHLRSLAEALSEGSDLDFASMQKTLDTLKDELSTRAAFDYKSFQKFLQDDPIGRDIVRQQMSVKSGLEPETEVRLKLALERRTPQEIGRIIRSLYEGIKYYIETESPVIDQSRIAYLKTQLDFLMRYFNEFEASGYPLELVDIDVNDFFDRNTMSPVPEEARGTRVDFIYLPGLKFESARLGDNTRSVVRVR